VISSWRADKACNEAESGWDERPASLFQILEILNFDETQRALARV
jgi:hypothetical protein